MGQKNSRVLNDNSLTLSLIDNNDEKIYRKTINYDKLIDLIKEAKRVEIKLYKA